MALVPCSPCACVDSNIPNDVFKQNTIITLCAILTAVGGEGSGPVRYDTEILCTPDDGTPVLIRYGYSTDGTVISLVPYNIANPPTPYLGSITALLDCSIFAESNERSNLIGINGVAPSVNTGTADAGTLRVVLASNVNVGENLVQLNGNTVSVGNGISGTGVLRVSLASDSTGNVATIGTSITPGQGAALLGKGYLTSSVASGDSIVGFGGITNDTGATLTANATRYSLPSINFQGALASVLDSRYQSAAATGLLKLESASWNNADAGVSVLYAVQATPVTNAADGQYGQPKLTTLGAQYIEPANQAATFPTMVTKAFGAVNGTYSSFVTNASKAVILEFDNSLDKDVYVSFDGTNNHKYVKAGTGKIFDLASDGRWSATNISVKTVDGTAATSGNIFGALTL